MTDTTLMDRMGIALLDVAADRTTGTMPVAGNVQPAGILHGGASAVLAETLGSVAAQEYAGPQRAAVGIELSITHHRPARDGVVTGEARALSLGRTLASYEIVITGQDGKRVATARLTCMIIDRR